MTRNSENSFIVCSVASLMAFLKLVEEVWDREKYVTFSWKIGPKSSMPQKALIHIWFRTWAAHTLKTAERLITKEQVEEMKDWVKRTYYIETSAGHMVKQRNDPFHPDKCRMVYTSIEEWGRGECHDVMEWMQLKAAKHGLILESTGEFQKLKQEQHR